MPSHSLCAPPRSPLHWPGPGEPGPPGRWLSDVVWPTPTPHIVGQADVRALHAQPARLQRLAQELPEPVTAWRLSPVVAARPAGRGVPGTVAVTLVAAMGALTRCDPPRKLMPCLGLGPSASSSRAHRRQGAMTTAGHPQARRVLVAGVWAS